MKYLLLWCVLLGALSAGPALAGPVDSPIPSNPCTDPDNGDLKLILVANGVGSSGPVLFCAAGPCVETMVVCTHSSKTGSDASDIAIEWFDEAGTSLGATTPACNVGPGQTKTFRTSPALSSPYTAGTVFSMDPSAPVGQGAIRVLATAKETICDVTLIDALGIFSDIPSTPRWNSDVIVTKSTAGQRGD
jgi:hypothetical protein